MADSLRITAPMLVVVIAAIKSTKSLYETVERFKDRNITIRRLQRELEDLVNVLDSLLQVINSEMSVIVLLKGPIYQCSQICREFEQSMKVFSRNSKTRLRDWTKMKFMGGDINDFIDIIIRYKSTVIASLGIINMHLYKASYQVFQEYNEIVQDTVYDLEFHLQRINEKVDRFTLKNTDTFDTNIDLNDERAVTRQCLLICQDARAFVKSLTSRELSLLQKVPQSATKGYMQNYFRGQLLTRQTLGENQYNLSETIGRLHERLESFLDEDLQNDNEKLQLQDDINILRQCLDVCKAANEVSHQRIFRIGEVIADNDSDQVVITTLADLFDAKRALSKGNSAQLIGLMTEEALRHLVDKRYSGCSGALAHDSVCVQDDTTISPSLSETQLSKLSFPTQTDNDEQPLEAEVKRNRPSPSHAVLLFQIVTLINRWVSFFLHNVMRLVELPIRKLRYLWQPRAPPGFVRISWACRCGELLQAVFQETNRAAAIEFVKEAAGPSNFHTISLSSPENETSVSSASSLSANFEASHASDTPSNSLSTSPSSNNELHHPIIAPRLNCYVLLCVNSGIHRISLTQVDVTHVGQDEVLFQRIRAAYAELRGKKARNMLIVAKTMQYIEFELILFKTSGECIGNFEKDLIPPEDKVLEQEYAYQPCPPTIGKLPIPPHIFMHLFQSPGDHTGCMATRRLPKKLGQKLTCGNNQLNAPIGWGIYIEEGYNWKLIIRCSGSAFLATFILTIVWCLLKNDVQGGTGIGQYSIAVIALALALFATENI